MNQLIQHLSDLKPRLLRRLRLCTECSQRSQDRLVTSPPPFIACLTFLLRFGYPTVDRGQEFRDGWGFEG